MQVRELAIEGAVEFTPTNFPDDRGLFVAPFQEEPFTRAVGHPLALGQTNHSVSARGVIRGVHFADVPPGQAKYVYCPRGALLDVVVDIRVGSPTFGKWEAIRLDEHNYRALYLAEGLGHAMMALADDTVLSYVCSTGYRPGAEHGVDPLDPALNLPWPTELERLLSEKDAAAPTLGQAREAGLLPDYARCISYYQQLTAP
ncbi:MAG: dTDP-4-dehydrorhamnose 3,5-epimerase family protein [Sciscionella sp.]